MRPSQKMNRRRKYRQQDEPDRHDQTRTPGNHPAKRQRERRRNDKSVDKYHGVQSCNFLEPSHQNVVKTLPRVPGLSPHGGGKNIDTWHRTGLQNDLTSPDVPSNAGIAQKFLRQRTSRE